MARSIDEIQTSLIESIKNTDESIDVAKGPIFDFLLAPVPSVLAETEARADRIARLVTAQLDQVATQDEVEAMATSFSVPLGTGRASRGRATFFTVTRPTSDIPIPRGTIIGTPDRQLTFFVTNATLVMESANADAYYVASRRRYEITANIEATSVGPDFDLPPQRIRTVLTPITGIEGVANLTETSGGLTEESLATSVARIRAKFAGLDPDSGGGISSALRNYAPSTIVDVALVFPKDRFLFRRRTNRPAIDAYVNGEDLTEVTESFVAVGGEQDIVLEQPPVVSVESVAVNGSEVDFAFLPDTSREVGGSTRGQDRVYLTTPLSLNDVFEVTYTTDSVIGGAQTELFDAEGRAFDTDILVRRKRVVSIAISLSARVLTSFDQSRVSDAIEASLTEQVESGVFGEELKPEVIRQNIKDAVGGISEIRFKLFQRTEGAEVDVEVISLATNEVAVIDQSALSIDVRK